MRIEFLDLIESNETLASGLFTLGHLLEIAENTGENANVGGVHELINLLARATQKQTESLKFVFQYTEQNWEKMSQITSN